MAVRRKVESSAHRNGPKVTSIGRGSFSNPKTKKKSKDKKKYRGQGK